jgi:hypothetical protein
MEMWHVDMFICNACPLDVHHCNNNFRRYILNVLLPRNYVEQQTCILVRNCCSGMGLSNPTGFLTFTAGPGVCTDTYSDDIRSAVPIVICRFLVDPVRIHPHT